ncbi:MAG TPA: TOBE domain-containing protein [Cyclobacteriaceae bacterium]|nr:TOBE domain-containing protein [Cyclobacteriaceae bacterium]HRW99937.1 TOBE domain-containing protein [Cyclobacteriaceae bacterium]
MNKLIGTIVELRTEGQMSLVSIKVGSHLISSIVLETPASASYLANRGQVNVLFKETEVILAKGPVEGISVQNKLPGKIVEIESAVLLSRVTIDIGTDKIVSIITTKGASQLNLKVNDEIVAMIKTNEITLSA